MTGAVAGAVTALVAFAVLDFVLITGPAVRRGELPEPNLPLLWAVIGTGAFIGGLLGRVWGTFRIGVAVESTLFGVLAGVAVVVALGLVSSSSYGPKRAEGQKAKWLAYGVPLGAVAGAAVGAARGRAKAPKKGVAVDDEFTAR